MSSKYRCIILIIINTLEILTSGQEWPILLFEEGDSGVIPCIPRGQATTFFWTRGEWYNISNEVAYNVNGVSGPDLEKFYVFSNGSLLLKNMTAMDEGNYYCRIASDRTQCHGSVTLYLKAANANKLPFIDQCSTKKGCTVYEKPSSRTFLTCKANQVSPDISLKWFIESKQITDGVEERQDKNAMNETVISSTINIKYTEPQFLTCQASSMKMETAFAHVQLQSEPVHGTSAGIIVVTVVLGATCAFLLGIVLYTFVKHNQNKKKKLEAKKKQPDTKRAEGESTPLHNNKNLDEITIELEQVKKDFSNETKQTQVLIETNNRELDRLKGELSDERKRTRDLGEKLSAENTKRSMEEKMKEEFKEKLQKTETKLRELEILQLKQTAMNEQGKGEGKKLNDLIDNLTRQIGENDQNLQDSEVELRSIREKLQKAEEDSLSLSKKLQKAEEEAKSLREKLQLSNQEIQTTKHTLTSYINKVKEKDEELTSTKDALQKTQETLKAEQKKVRETEEKLQLSKRDLEAAESKIKSLSGSHELYLRQLRSNVLEDKDNYTTFCRIKTAKRKKDSFISRKDEFLLKTHGSEYKYSFIFPDNASRADVFSRLEDLVQNAIDGGQSAILVHGNCPEHNLFVMYGSVNEIDEGIVLKTIRKIFQVTRNWTTTGYAAEINTSFAKIFPGRGSEFTFSSVEGLPKANRKYIFTNDDLEVKDVKVSVSTEDVAISFLKKCTEKQIGFDQKQVFTNDFVQFFITTKFKSKEISTGTLTFVLYNDAEALKDCFKDHHENPLFPRYFSSMINAEGSKVRILSNIDEDKKEEAKDHLKFSNWILKEKSTFSRFKKFFSKSS